MPRCRRAPVRASGYDIIKSGLFERRPSLAVVGTKRGRPDPHPRWAVLLDAARRYGCGRDQIETPGEGDPVRRQGVVRYGLSWYFAGFNRDKRSLTLNLRHHEGCAVLEKLIAGSDVLVKNFRPGDLRGGCVLVAAGARERAAAYGQRRGPNRLAGGRRRAALALFAWRGGDRCRLGRLG